jgi:hypothetical protein
MLTNQYLKVSYWQAQALYINCNSTLDISVVLFNTIIKVFAPPNFDVFISEIISVNYSNRVVFYVKKTQTSIKR